MIKNLKINYNQLSIELKKKQTEITMLKKVNKKNDAWFEVKKREQIDKSRNAVKDKKIFIDKINYKERKKKEVDGNRRFELDRKQCAWRHEVRKEEWRNETSLTSKEGMVCECE